MTRRLLGVLMLTMALLGGCGTAPDAPSSVQPATIATDSTLPAPLPTTLRIPALNVDEQLAYTGLNPDRTITVPPVTSPEVPSWYDQSPAPGATGPAIVLGHVNGTHDGTHVPGVFAKLDKLIPGDEILIDRQGAALVRFVVYAVEQHPKSAFPTARVYGDTDGPELRLITCGGVFDPTARNYVDNVIVFARGEA